MKDGRVCIIEKRRRVIRGEIIVCRGIEGRVVVVEGEGDDIYL